MDRVEYFERGKHVRVTKEAVADLAPPELSREA